VKTARFQVFSGTGNSLHLARHNAARLEACRSARHQGDLDLFFFPVYAAESHRGPRAAESGCLRPVLAFGWTRWF
jgi:hypothetical protein